MVSSRRVLYQLWPAVDVLVSSRSVASWPNVIVSISSASAADETGEGNSSSDGVVSTWPLRAAAVECSASDGLFISGADSRRRPIQPINQSSS